MLTGQELPEFLRRHDLVRVVPQTSEAHGYQLAVPRGWLGAPTIEGAVEATGIPTMVGIFMPEAKPGRPKILVTTMRMPEVDLVDLARTEHGLSSWTLAAVDRVQGPDRVRHLSHSVHQDRTRVRLQFVDSGRIWTVQAVARTKDWRSMQSLLFSSLETFELAQPTYDERLEPRTTWEEGSHQVEAPGTFRWSSELGGRGAVATSPKGGIVRVRFQHDTDTPPQHRAYRVLREFGAESWRPESAWEAFELPTPPQELLGSWQAVFRCGPLHRLTMVAYRSMADGGVVEVTGLTPPREDDPLGWMRVRRAMAIALQTAR